MPPPTEAEAVALEAGAAAVPGELIVRFDAGLDAADRRRIRERARAEFGQALPGAGLQVVNLGSGDSLHAAEARFEREKGVLYAEPNVYRRASRPADGPYFDQLWALQNSGQTLVGVTGTSDADPDAVEAWDLTTGSADVTVAIVDSGIDTTHPDLSANAWTNPGETGSGREANGRDDDGNGLVDDRRGWDWSDGDGDPADANGHGTHVAGTVGARGGNGTGTAGVSWNVRLMPLRVLDRYGSGTLDDVVGAYAYAARNGARVVNMSFGGNRFSRAEYDAIRSASEVLFVAAAGNNGQDSDVAPAYPCAYDLDNVVCVAASDQRDALAGFSNYGARSVDLAAPGVNVLSTQPGAAYGYADGTSMATPHVTGAAALVLARRPAASPSDVKGALLGSVDPGSSLVGKTVTGGRLNVRTALDAPAPGP